MIDITRLSPAELDRFIHIQSVIARQQEDADKVKAARDYYSGNHPVMLTQRQQEFLGKDLTSGNYAFNHNLVKVVVDTLRERLNVTGFTVNGHSAEESDNADGKLACFCTAPNIRQLPQALFCEVLGTFLLVLPIFLMTSVTIPFPTSSGSTEIPVGLGSLGLIPVALLVFGIGLSLGGTTGYAINPARDLGPRLAHFLLPIPGKRNSDWGYAWVPVVGPLIGGALAAAVNAAIH